ncbi:unnamed protein product [Spodoptera littoralis]|uniref:Uncharacterized protein n=1 Tax=Spodoptera littoralis TaxID=7109 RepID=A0A9P0II04_SPOLI|nr:unnamed protein product [Spodoptera littoralis]CAH1647927.1 unnamed protein product [Spodoptera littoralis]
MARALLLALTCAAAASAARYVDYSGVKMPAYGSVAAGDYDAPREGGAPASDDYRGQSPDAPASPDYKYEEEPRIKTEKPMKDSDDSEVWRKPGRKQRGLIRTMDSATADVIHKFERDEEEFPKLRPNHRYAKHRSRLKHEGPRDEESPSRRPVKYSRDRKDVVSDIDRKDYFHLDKDDFPDDKSKEFDDDVKFLNEATTRRRRKPRDRQMKRKSSDLDLAYDDEADVDRRMKGDVDKEPPRRTRPPDARPADRFRTLVEDEDEDMARGQPANKLRPKSYDDYDDYYDMKRVNSIKSKLPSLLRRTTERAHRPTPTSYLDKLWTNRRMLPPGRKRYDDDDDEQADNLLEHSHRASHATATTERTPPSTTTPSTTTTTTIRITTTSVITTTAISTAANVYVNNTELSLAEKSRLSILKKDQRKEGLHIDPPTKKPPVLLQVTRYVPTVVMVEPPSSIIPWMRASEVSDDNPERIIRVKKLMRHKLVSSSKNINELTENWDQQVCDYVDTALLDDACPLRLQRTSCCILIALACTFLNTFLINDICLHV